jgi:hypothetical protein
MKGSIHARVRRIATSPEGRALIQAVDDAGFEAKLEVPVESVRGVSSDQGHFLVLSWSLQPSPRAVEPTTAPAPTTAPTPTTSATPNAVDQAFMELMGRPRGSTPDATAAPTEARTSTPAASSVFVDLLKTHLT